jgi:hypothetical protein
MPAADHHVTREVAPLFLAVDPFLRRRGIAGPHRSLAV